MIENIQISLQDWKKCLAYCTEDYNIYAPVSDNTLEYELISKDRVGEIAYNIPKTISPLKSFFLPFKESVTCEIISDKNNLIIGVPSCDLTALDILDEIYMQEPYIDPYYKSRRDNSVLIGTDCYSIMEHCHCNTYNLKAYPFKNFDVSLSLIEDSVLLLVNSEKGMNFIEFIKKHGKCKKPENQYLELINEFRATVEGLLTEQNKDLPDYTETGQIVSETEYPVWAKYSKSCVSCGACSTICPTCTCFLLADSPNFGKVRLNDTCQHPGFALIAAGEDQLGDLPLRFRNRYLCKYVWKPEKFKSVACTGCGRCIETCIGNINKNKLFVEQAKLITH